MLTSSAGLAFFSSGKGWAVLLWPQLEAMMPRTVYQRPHILESVNYSATVIELCFLFRPLASENMLPGWDPKHRDKWRYMFWCLSASSQASVSPCFTFPAWLGTVRTEPQSPEEEHLPQGRAMPAQGVSGPACLCPSCG